MKILYGIQGTGNGHITRALEILPALKKKGEVDILISGIHSELKLPFEVKYKYKGLGFVFGKKGGIDYLETYKKNKLKRLFKEVKSLPVKEYDIVISDFEPVTAWACIRHNKPCLGLSNQASLQFDEVPKASSDDHIGKFIIRNYAPCKLNIGFSYQEFNAYTRLPVIRSAMRNAELRDQGHYTVYLPSYGDKKLLKVLSELDGHWHLFSKYTDKPYTFAGVSVFPLDKSLFEESVTNSTGVISAAGFGTTTEALFMGKKLLVVPQKQQYEQACNAAMLKNMNVSVLKSFKKKHLASIEQWMQSTEGIKVHYPDYTSSLVDDAISMYTQYEDPYVDYLTEGQYQLHRA